MSAIPLRIAIIGAGPAGCTLARLLLTLPLPTPSTPRPTVHIFEGEASADIRRQGGTLDLHTATGQQALRECGLYDEFLAEARFDGEALTVADKRFVTYLKLGSSTHDNNHNRGRPEIDRSALRRILIESLPEGLIQWGRRLCKVDVTSKGDLVLLFEPTAGGNPAVSFTSSGYDLIVGADGAFSKVRPLVSDTAPLYSGISGFTFNIPTPADKVPALHAAVAGGSIFSFSDGRSLTIQQLGEGKLYCNAWAVRSEDWLDNLPFDIQDGQAVKAALLREYADWDLRLVAALEAGDESSFTGRKLWMLPVGMTWQGRKGVTLIGDAAHLATPFAGEGVNIAMQDAQKLAHAILGDLSLPNYDPRTDLAERVRTFESEMFDRAKAVQERAYGNMVDMYFTPGAPRTTIERWVLRGLSGTFSGWQHVLAGWIVYAGYFIYKLFVW